MSNILAYKRNKKAFGKIIYRFFKANMSYKKVLWIIQARSFFTLSRDTFRSVRANLL